MQHLNSNNTAEISIRFNSMAKKIEEDETKQANRQNYKNTAVNYHIAVRTLYVFSQKIASGEKDINGTSSGKFTPEGNKFG